MNPADAPEERGRECREAERPGQTAHVLPHGQHLSTSVSSAGVSAWSAT